MKFEIGKVIMHRNLGLCTVIALTERDGIPYYKLQTYYEPHSLLLVPKKGDHSTCREVMSRKECEELFEYMKTMEITVNLANKQKKDVYTKMLYSNDPKQLARLSRSLYLYKEEKRNTKQILSLEDTHIFQAAATYLHNEISFVYGIEVEQVIPFIAEKIS